MDEVRGGAEVGGEVRVVARRRRASPACLDTRDGGSARRSRRPHRSARRRARARPARRRRRSPCGCGTPPCCRATCCASPRGRASRRRGRAARRRRRCSRAGPALPRLGTRRRPTTSVRPSPTNSPRCIVPAADVLDHRQHPQDPDTTGATNRSNAASTTSRTGLVARPMICSMPATRTDEVAAVDGRRAAEADHDVLREVGHADHLVGDDLPDRDHEVPPVEQVGVDRDRDRLRRSDRR